MSDQEKNVCSGRGCTNPSIGHYYDLKVVPQWRTTDDRPANQRQFDFVSTVYFCEVHEEIAKAYQSPVG